MTERTSHRHFVPCMGGSALTPFYDILHRFSGLGAVHEKMISVAELQPGQRVLDIGCGTGNLLLALGRDHPGVEIEGLDPDARALAKAARKAHRAGVAASWRPGYAQDLPHADGSVDRVFSSLMLHHLHDDKDALLAEVRRVLRPGGWLGLVWNGPDPREVWEYDLARLDPDTAGRDFLADPADEPFEVDGLAPDELEWATFRWLREIDGPGLAGRLRTHSAFAVMPPDERERLIDAMVAVVTAETERRGTPTVPLRQSSHCARWRPT